MQRTDFSDQIADYINGHLDEAQTEAMETAMRQDAELARQVEFDRLVKASVQAPQTADALPHFAQVRAHIEQQRPVPAWQNWLQGNRLIPVAAAALVVAIALNMAPAEQVGGEDFQTLSDTVQATQPMLRIIAMPGSDADTLRALTNELNLDPITWHQGGLAVDVTVTEEQAPALISQLEQDPRVRAVTQKAAQ